MGDEDGLMYNDPDINVQWPIPEEIELILSKKDKVQHSLRAYIEKYID